MPKFKKGDLIVIVQNVRKTGHITTKVRPDLVGVEGTVANYMGVMIHPINDPHPTYRVFLKNGMKRDCAEPDLRLIPPKREIDKIVSWDDMPWQPKKILTVQPKNSPLEEWEEYIPRGK